MPSFYEKLNTAWERFNSLVCVGLDPDIAKIPQHLRESGQFPIFEFNRRIIDAVAPFCCAFKPQIAYYAGQGPEADIQLATTMEYIRTAWPDHVLILDAKRGDIGSTAAMYAREAFERYQADAVTLNPYMGGDTLEPFLSHADKGSVVLCRTSNPGSGDLQDLELADGRKLYQAVAEKAANAWNGNKNIALVVGATYPEQLAEVRGIVGADMPILVPGIGAQGGDIEAVMKQGLNADKTGLVVNSSRGIIYSSHGEKFAETAGWETMKLKEAINEWRQG